MSRLPEREELFVEERKVTDYLLNLEHDEGGNKARFFIGRGFAPEAWQVFADAMTDHGRSQPVTSTETTRHGKKFVVECQIVSPDGRNPCILSVWIKEQGRPLRLVTAHPNS